MSTEAIKFQISHDVTREGGAGESASLFKPLQVERCFLLPNEFLM